MATKQGNNHAAPGAPLHIQEIRELQGLANYGLQAYLVPAVQELRAEASAIAPALKNRRIWMLNSTASGGGVAEMLPKIIRIMRDLGFDAEWAVMGTDRPEFFTLTKKIHNLIHGVGDPSLTADDRKLFESVSRRTADALRPRLGPGDILVVHDPQPMAVGAFLKRETGIPCFWRSHIGLDEDFPATRAAWDFLKPYASGYDGAVFTAPEYIPDYFAGRSTVITPAIDPSSFKNRELPTNKIFGIMCNSDLSVSHSPVLTPAWENGAKRLQPDGSFASATRGAEIGLGHRPIVTQISRWDALKGWAPLMKGFVRLKEGLAKGNNNRGPRHRRRLEIVRLVLAGPDPASIQDDPEGKATLNELIQQYVALPPAIRADIALLSLPMSSRKQNALMVNVLQRCSSVVVQNSLREGFGLTATEAMWKRMPVMATYACGLKLQIRDGIEGRLVEDPEDPAAIARLLDEMLGDPKACELFGRRAQRRVYDEFLVFAQVRKWLRLLGQSVDRKTTTRRRSRS